MTANRASGSLRSGRQHKAKLNKPIKQRRSRLLYLDLCYMLNIKAAIKTMKNHSNSNVVCTLELCYLLYKEYDIIIKGRMRKWKTYLKT